MPTAFNIVANPQPGNNLLNYSFNQCCGSFGKSRGNSHEAIPVSRQRSTRADSYRERAG